MTYRWAVHSIQTTMKKNFDDTEITIPHILYWISVVANKYIARDLDKGKRSGAYLSIFKNVAVKWDDHIEAHYIDLPRGLICLDYDAGVEFITYNRHTCCCEGPRWAQTNFDPTTAGALQMNYGDEHEKPTSADPLYYIVGGYYDGVNIDRIYFAGTECITLKDVMLGIYTGVDPKEICSLDDNLPLKHKYHDQLVREVVTLARFMMLIPEDRVNEGSDEGQAPPVQVPQSVPVEQAQQNIDQA